MLNRVLLFVGKRVFFSANLHISNLVKNVCTLTVCFLMLLHELHVAQKLFTFILDALE